ncbi:hypothetical protein [uncultured Sphingomonas sp.]|uniref:hypothetical protein n=1 Tax=uncultured Sphingomonas sp. TaxID=158754 RepID=UPI0030DCE7F1
MTPPPRSPIWLAAPTRFAGLSIRGAHLAAALALFLLIACFSALPAPAPPPVSPEATAATEQEDRADVILYQHIVAGLRAGDDYYSVVANALRTGDYPLKPFVTFRLPTLAKVQAAIPDLLSATLLFALAGASIAAWYRRLGPHLTHTAPRLVAGALAIGGLSTFVRPDLIAFHEVWAAPLLALSLATWRPGKATVAIALALAAMLIRETAAVYAGVMVLAALVEGRRREVVGWIAAVAVFAAAVAVHAHAVAQVVRPDDPASPGWSGMLGFGFFVKAMTLATALSALPALLAAPLVGVALIGWAGWRDPVACRALGVLGSYALLLAVFCRVDTYYWGILAAPILPIGLVFAPDTLRDLWRSVHQRRRRISVTRTIR